MIRLLFTAIFLEAVTIMLLLFKTPLRKLVILSLDRVKRGRGPVMMKTLGGTVLVMLLSTVYSVLKIQKRRIEDGAVNHTDQVLMAKHLLEATLMGAVLFHALMVDRLRHYLKEFQIQRKNMEAMKKESQELKREAQEFKAQKAEEIKALEKEKTRLGAKLEGLESELQANIKNVNVAKVNAVALRKQSEGFLVEYDRMLKEKQELRGQLQSLDYQKLSRSASKKNM